MAGLVPAIPIRGGAAVISHLSHAKLAVANLAFW